MLTNLTMLAAMSALITPGVRPSPGQQSFDLSDKSHPMTELCCGARPDGSTVMKPRASFQHNSDETSDWRSLICCGRPRHRDSAWENDPPSWGGGDDPPLSGDGVALDTTFPSKSPTQSVADLVSTTSAGLRAGLAPIPLEDGLAGAYVLLGADGKRAGVFKPSDEEVGCVLNPKGQSPRHSVFGARDGIEPGMSMYREVAASVLDHGNFASVPPTCLVQCQADVFKGVKTGSLQKYVLSECVSGDLGYSLFSLLDVQKIALLDMRLLNLDRHDGNILVTAKDDGSYSLVPIDHGCCLPTRLEVSDLEWCWMNWPQTKAVIHPDVQAYAASLDSESDTALLTQAAIPLSANSMRVLRITTAFVKLGIAHGLTLFDLATAMARQDSAVPSALERVVLRSKWKAAAKALRSETAFDDELQVALSTGLARLVVNLVRPKRISL